MGFLYFCLILFNIVLALIPVYKKPKSLFSWAFFATVIVLSQWMFSCYKLWTDTNYTFWVRLAFFGPAFLPLTLFLFTLNFPKKIDYSKLIWLPILVLASTLLAFLSLTDFVVKIMTSPIDVQFNYGHKIYGLYFIGAILSNVFIIVKNIKLYDEDSRIRLVYFYVGLFSTLICGTFTNLLLPMLGKTQFTLVGPLFATILVLLTNIAILKEKMADLRLTITERLSDIVVIILVFLSLLTINAYIPESNIKIFALFLWGCGLAFFGILLRNFLVTTVKHSLIPGFYDPAEVNNIILKAIKGKTDGKAIFKTTTELIDKEIQVEQIAYYVAKRDKNGFIIGYTRINPDTQSEHDIEANDPFVVQFEFLLNSDQPKVIPLFEALKDCPSDIQNLFKITEKFPIESQCLLFHTPGVIEGIIVLGKRSKDVKYVKADFDFFDGLIETVSSVLYRLSPYEKLRKEFVLTEKQLYDEKINSARSEKSEFLNYFLRGYAHEMHTPLSFIKYSLAFLPDEKDVAQLMIPTRHLSESEEIKLRKKVEKIPVLKEECCESAENALEIVESTLQLFRDELSLKKSLVNLNKAIEETSAKLKKGEKSENIICRLDLGQIPLIQGVAHQIPLIFSNVIKNAIEAMPNGGTITIRSRIDEDDSNKIRVDISDTGIGMPPDVLNRIWDPFFTTHVHTGRGNGLGIVHRFIQDNGGHIEVKSEVGKGSVFSIFFPIPQ